LCLYEVSLTCSLRLFICCYLKLYHHQFRQEYRLERKVLNELSIDPETFPVDEEELSNLVAAATTTPSTSRSNSFSQGSSRHRISRVVVLHNDKLETFFNPQQEETSILAEESPSSPAPGNSGASSDFFDHDSFWSGSLTWY
jgi:hypothetical protein